MSDVNWRREMKEMLWNIERHATYSLTNIRRSQSLNNQFQQLFLRLTNERLAKTYSRVQKRLNKRNQDKNDGGQNKTGASVSEQSPNSVRDDFDLQLNQNTNNVNLSDSVKQEVTDQTDARSNQNVIADNLHAKSTEPKIGANEVNEIVEIYDSNDEETSDESGEMQLNRIKNVIENRNDIENESNAAMNVDNSGEKSDDVVVKNEVDDDWIKPKQEIMDEDIPIRIFNPNDVSSNGGYITGDDVARRSDSGSSLSHERNGKGTARGSDETLAAKPSGSKDSKRFSCGLCGYGSDQKGNFNVHMRTHTNEKPYRCSRCDKCFTQSSTLKRHITTHKEEFPFHCSGCFRGFSQEIVKKVHETNCRNRRYECFICKYVTINKTLLVRHMRTHSGIKPYRCSRCSKRFATLQRLKLHKTTHKDRKFPFHCKGCFRRFSRKDEKEDHENGCRNRRYECHLCKKFVTTHKTDLEIHMRRHTGEKPFRCEVCLKYFQVKYGLKKHLNTIHSRRT